MSWIEVKAYFRERPLDVSPLLEIYREFGIENTLEEELTITGCAPEVEGARARMEELADRLRSVGAEAVSIGLLEETNWEESWKQFFKPRRIGNRFVVQPTWENFEAGPDDIVLTIDPGMAFGTGDHPTTRLCLELLETLELEGAKVADLGCGSGILAIAASKLGAVVEASDIDPLAVEVTKENATRNDVSIDTFVGDGLKRSVSVDLRDVPQDETPLDSAKVRGLIEEHGQPRTYDAVLSNIISATLIGLARPVAAATNPGGAWIVSGIIATNWDLVRNTIERSDFELIEVRHEDDWVAARFRRLTVEE